MKPIPVIAILLALTINCDASEPQKKEIEFLVKEGAKPSYFAGEFGQISIAVDKVSDTDSRNVVVIKMDDSDGDNPTINYAKVFLYGDGCVSEPKTIINYGARFPGGYVLPQTFTTLDQACIRVNFYHTDGNFKGRVVDDFLIKLSY